MNAKIFMLGLLLFIVEIFGIVLYTIAGFNSENYEDNLIEAMIKNFKENKITYNDINRYYYLLEFKKLFSYYDYEKSFEAYDFSSRIIILFTFIYAILILINFFVICKNIYKDVKNISLAALIVSLSFLINSFLYSYKVNMPEKEIYVFDDETNDEIRKKLTEKLNIKIKLVGFSVMIIVTFIIHIIFGEYLIKKETKKEENNILSPIIKIDNGQDNQINLKDINEPIIN